ncbi:hypothetical protein K8R30_03390 [archaeon]|nr:hypothetical protein [archaeon]
MAELLIGFLVAGIFFVGAILVQTTGALLADWMNHKRNLGRLNKEHKNKIDYMKKQLIFKKKIEFLDRISMGIEEIMNSYSSIQAVIDDTMVKQISEKFGEKITPKFKSDEIMKALDELEDNKNSEKFSSKGRLQYAVKSKEVKRKTIEFLSNHMKIIGLALHYANNIKNKKLKSELKNLIDNNLPKGRNLIKEIAKDLR